MWGRKLDRSKALLKKMGLEDGVEIDLYFTSNPTLNTVAEKLKSNLEEAGIHATLKPMEEGVYLTEMRARKLPTAIGDWTPNYLDPTMWTDYFAFPNRGISARMLYDNPMAAEQAVKIQTLPDGPERAQAIGDLQDILIEDMPFTMLYQTQRVVASRTELKGYKLHPVWFVDLFTLSK